MLSLQRVDLLFLVREKDIYIGLWSELGLWPILHCNNIFKHEKVIYT